MRAALHEREELIEARADALEAALTENAPWTKALGTPPNDRRRAAAWRKSARVVAAYRDRYRITDDAPLGPPPESAAQKIDAARARSRSHASNRSCRYAHRTWRAPGRSSTDRSVARCRSPVAGGRSAEDTVVHLLRTDPCRGQREHLARPCLSAGAPAARGRYRYA